MILQIFSLHSNGPPKETPPKSTPDVELDVVHEKKPPSASRGSKRVSSMRSDAGESARTSSQKKKLSSRSGVSPQGVTSTLATMPEDAAEDKEPNELVK